MFRNSIIIIIFGCFQQLECILVFVCILYIKYYVYSLLYSLIYCIGHRVKNTTFELNFHSTSFNPNEFESFDSIRFIGGAAEPAARKRAPVPSVASSIATWPRVSRISTCLQ